VVYLYDGQKIVETRLGEETTFYQQFIHGTQYIDELVMVRVKDKGDLYVHQDANWNVIGLTDLGGSVVERYVYTPYGEVTVYDETGYGDYDEDNEVMGEPPSTSDADYTAFTGACAGSGPTGACRKLDLDFDGDVDTTDRDDYFMSLPHGLARHPGRTATAVDQPFGHQGLLFESEIGSYQNRARQYDPAKRRFIQRDAVTFTTGVFEVLWHYMDGMNLYECLLGSPVNRTDPLGEHAGKPGDQHESYTVGQFCGHISLTTSCTVPNIAEDGPLCIFITQKVIRDRITRRCSRNYTYEASCPNGMTCVLRRVINPCVTFPWTLVHTVTGCTITATLSVTIRIQGAYGRCESSSTG